MYSIDNCAGQDIGEAPALKCDFGDLVQKKRQSLGQVVAERQLVGKAEVSDFPLSAKVRRFARRSRRYYLPSPPRDGALWSPYGDSKNTITPPSSDSSELESLSDSTSQSQSPSLYETLPPVATSGEFYSNYVGSSPESALSKTLQPSIFQVPEILHKIIEYADIQSTVVPQEFSPVRRRPLSEAHAVLIYGDKMKATSAMKDHPVPVKRKQSGVLYNCLQVNNLFYRITKEILLKKLYFSDERKFCQFIRYANNNSSVKYKTNLFVLHKLVRAKQNAIDSLKDCIDFRELEWIEFFLCPKILPTPDFFVHGYRIKKLVITGSKVLDDLFLNIVAQNCPNLESLDLRACELITDAGIYNIARCCKKLVNVNLGRKNNGHLVTDASIALLIQNNPNLNTLGLAGCHVSDVSIWKLAIFCNHSLERLSLNNCPYISDRSIPLILMAHYFPNLSVLELRFVHRITNFKAIIEFVRLQRSKGISLLIEVCEPLCYKMRKQELEMDKDMSKRISNDILQWANDINDGDIPFNHFLQSRDSY